MHYYLRFDERLVHHNLVLYTDTLLHRYMTNSNRCIKFAACSDIGSMCNEILQIMWVKTELQSVNINGVIPRILFDDVIDIMYVKICINEISLFLRAIKNFNRITSYSPRLGVQIIMMTYSWQWIWAKYKMWIELDDYGNKSRL